MRLSRIVAVSLIGVLCLPAGLSAQVGPRTADPPRPAPLRLGPVVVAPTLTLANLGWDSNVLHRQGEAEPAGDFTATVKPEVRSWFRFGRARFQGRSTVDFVYFRDHSSERSVDTNHEGRFELRLGKVTPYAAGHWVSARQRFGFEIDDRTRRGERTAVAGVDLQVGLRTSVEVVARRTRLEFDSTGVLRDPLVSDFYDFTSRGVTVAVRHELSPVTSASVIFSRNRDRFDLAPDRDSDSRGFGAGVEFKPAAAISGRAYVGWRRMELVQPGSPPFRGVATSAELTYTLLGATQLTVEAERDLSYSAIRGQHAYLLAGVRGTVRHRLNETWDVGMRTGRHGLSYGLFGRPVMPGDVPEDVFDGDHETVIEYSGEIGYRPGLDTRLAFTLGRQQRGSALGAARGYERIRAGLSLNYRF